MDPLQSFRLDGRVVVVTGASSGLGAGFARAVAAVGADVALVARRADRLEELASELTAGGARTTVVATDVSSVEDCRRAAEPLAADHGRIDVLVNNAGLGAGTPAHRETPESFASVIDVNLAGAFWMAHSCAPHMRPGSAIVNVASVLAHVTSRFPDASYAASKAGLVGLTRSLAQEWGGERGIRVNALCPGYFATEMTTRGQDALRAMVAEQSILGRFGEQQELDGALLFLASPASSYVTGASILVDGGFAAL